MSVLLRRSGIFRDAPRPIRGQVVKAVVPSAYFRRQDILGRLAAAVFLLPALVITGVLALLVRLTSRGPAIFRQRRVGLHGNHFTMYKIRTMRHDAERNTGPVWSLPGDPRVTLVGRFLRAFHLDELPQFINVLRGDMALVGPRPERPDFASRLALEIPGYLERLRVKPGITGLAQVNLPPDTDLDSVRRKLAVDLEYVESASLRMDLSILLCTFLRLFGLKGRWTTSFLGIKRLATSTASPNSPSSVSTAASPSPSPNGKLAK